MSTINTGGPAFPNMLKSGDLAISEGGMNLRDYFAAKAMNGYLANSWQARELDATGESSSEQMRIVADISYAMADAMLAAREVKP